VSVNVELDPNPKKPKLTVQQKKYLEKVIRSRYDMYDKAMREAASNTFDKGPYSSPFSVGRGGYNRVDPIAALPSNLRPKAREIAKLIHELDKELSKLNAVIRDEKMAHAKALSALTARLSRQREEALTKMFLLGEPKAVQELLNDLPTPESIASLAKELGIGIQAKQIEPVSEA
jgi:hypothetical protein